MYLNWLSVVPLLKTVIAGCRFLSIVSIGIFFMHLCDLCGDGFFTIHICLCVFELVVCCAPLENCDCGVQIFKYHFYWNLFHAPLWFVWWWLSYNTYLLVCIWTGCLLCPSWKLWLRWCRFFNIVSIGIFFMHLCDSCGDGFLTIHICLCVFELVVCCAPLENCDCVGADFLISFLLESFSCTFVICVVMAFLQYISACVYLNWLSVVPLLKTVIALGPLCIMWCPNLFKSNKLLPLVWQKLILSLHLSLTHTHTTRMH